MIGQTGEAHGGFGVGEPCEEMLFNLLNIRFQLTQPGKQERLRPNSFCSTAQLNYLRGLLLIARIFWSHRYYPVLALREEQDLEKLDSIQTQSCWLG